MCGETYVPNSLDKYGWPVCIPGWRFVCWTPGKLAEASFIHKPEACCIVLRAKIDAMSDA